MIPGENLTAPGDIDLNDGTEGLILTAAKIRDRAVQVGSLGFFAEYNGALGFDRVAEKGFRLDIAAGTAARFEPGQSRDVTLVPNSGARRVIGFNQTVMGDLG